MSDKPINKGKCDKCNAIGVELIACIVCGEYVCSEHRTDNKCAGCISLGK